MAEAEGASTPASRDPKQVVEAFLGALERFDIQAAVDLLHPEAVYQNVPLPPARGRTAVARQLAWMGRYGSGFEARMHNIAVDGSVVLTERTDVLSVGAVSAAFWVCGTFEVRDGLIILWRDRFDYLDVTLATVRGALQAAGTTLMSAVANARAQRAGANTSA